MSTTLFYFVCELFNTYIFCMQKIYKLSMSRFGMGFCKKHHKLYATLCWNFSHHFSSSFCNKKRRPVRPLFQQTIFFFHQTTMLSLKNVSDKNNIAGTQRFQLHLFSYMAILKEKPFFHANHFNFSEISLPTSINRLIFVS